jgi:hypothetical protein
VEECFQAGKNEAGLDHYQVRLCQASYRYVTLAMLALAVSPPPARSAASSTPAAGHDGAAATSNAPATAITSGNSYKIPKC